MKADIQTNRQLAEMVLKSAQLSGGVMSMTPATQGMADVAIDVERMKRDPVYAKEIQQKVQKMSPQEQMAFSKKLMEPQNQAAQQDVQAMTQETPAVQAAVDAVTNWPQQQMARASANAAIAREMDQLAQRAVQKPFPIQRPSMDYDSIACDDYCQGQWKVYGEKLWPLVLARETDILLGRRAALQRDRENLLGVIQEGNQHLMATQYGAAARSESNRVSIVGYHQGLLGEVDRLIDQTETAAKRAAFVVNGGVEKFFIGLSR